MNKYFLHFSAALAMVLALGSCTADDSTSGAKGEAMISLNRSMAFTRAVDFAAAEDIQNYTIDINDADGNCVFSKVMSEIENQTVELEEGSYMLTAHYGELKAASQNDLQLSGNAPFTIQAGKTAEVSVTCTPASARVNVNFDSNMDEFFSDYYVTFSTKALDAEGSAAVWTKTNSEPWYLLVENEETVKAIIHVTRASDGKSLEIERTTTLSAAKAWTLGIQAEDNGDKDGVSSFSIIIDESTNDKEETITVPDSWWM